MPIDSTNLVASTLQGTHSATGANPPRMSAQHSLHRLPGLDVRAALSLALFCLMATHTGAAAAVTFTDIGVGLPGVSSSSVAWGDYDNDGDLDLVLTGSSISRIYQNSGGPTPTFTDIGAGLPGVNGSSVAWGDYDNDGDLDLLLTGETVGGFISRIYRNSGGAMPTFTDIGAGLTGVRNSSVAWGDYDNDGHLDLVLIGFDSVFQGVAQIYRNSGGATPTFADIGAGLPGVADGSVAWGDYDNDGDLDLVLTGLPPGSSTPISRIYRNTGGAFTDIATGLTGVRYSGVAWGDYDNDGDLDLALTGLTSTFTVTSRIYQNSGGAFTDLVAGLAGVFYSAVAWGDYDNDGNLDLVVTGIGQTIYSTSSRIYQNSGGATPTFTDIVAGLTGVNTGSVAWGDYDNDGDLDLLLTGFDGSSSDVSQIYQCSGVPINAPPSAPGNLAAVEYPVSVWTFSWTAPADDHTPAGGLTYNLRVGTTPGGNDLSSAMAAAGGFRRVVRRGNTEHRLSWTLPLPPGATCYWSVQCLDGAFAGSAFAPEQSFVVTGFTPADTGLADVFQSSVAWGDYDNDGDLDIVVAGKSAFSFIPSSKIYRSSGGATATFTDIVAGLPGVFDGSVAWGDYDNDGDVDLVLTGDTGAGFVSRIYRNSGGATPTFTDIGAGLPGVRYSSVAWGDYDNDGDLDLLLTGHDGSVALSRIYRNSGGAGATFTDIGAGLTGVYQSSVAWADYDNDGDLDILLAGSVSLSGRISRIYRNSGGATPTFTDIVAGLPGVFYCSAAWGDYDNDGDPDLVLTGSPSFGGLARIYRNAGGTFTDIVAGLQGIFYSSVAWGDYDNDGDLDLLLTGWNGTGPVSRIYRNSGGAAPTFTDIGAGLTGVYRSSAAWGDYDNDGILDVVLTGNWAGLGGGFSQIYRSVGLPLNVRPSAPSNLAAAWDSLSGYTLSWTAPADDHTPAPALTYNLRVGVTRGGDEVSSAMASAGGYRRVVERGNTDHRLSRTLWLPEGPTYYWSVQALDGVFAGSAFAPLDSITAHATGVPDEGTAALPAKCRLYPCTPNPSTERTTIRFDLPETAPVTLDVYDASGRLVRRLASDDTMAGGRHVVDWDGRNGHGDAVAAGVYTVRLVTRSSSSAGDARAVTSKVVIDRAR